MLLPPMAHGAKVKSTWVWVFFGEQHMAPGSPLLSSHIPLVAESGTTRLGLVSVAHSRLHHDLTGWQQCLSFTTGKSGADKLIGLWDD